MRKMNVRSPFFVTVSQEVAKVDPTDPCITDPSGVNCLPEDPCIANPNASGCQPVKVDDEFITTDLACDDVAKSIGSVGAVVFNYDIDVAGRQNGTYTIDLKGIKVPVRFRFGLITNVPEKDLGSGDSFTIKGLTTFSGDWDTAGYATTDLVAPPSSGQLDIQDTFVYNSSSHSGNLRFQIHIPIQTTSDMSVEVTCPSTITGTAPSTSGFVTMVSFSALNFEDAMSPTVKVNGSTLSTGVIGSDATSSSVILGVERVSGSIPSTRRFMSASSTSGANSSGLYIIDGGIISDRHTSRNINFMGDVDNHTQGGVKLLKNLQTNPRTVFNTTLSYQGDSFLSDALNTITVQLPTGLSNTLDTEKLRFQIVVSRHPIYNITGISGVTNGNYIQPVGVQFGTGPQNTEAIICQGILYGPNALLTFKFKGSNNTELMDADTINANGFALIQNEFVENNNLGGQGIPAEEFASVTKRTLRRT